MKPGKGDVAIQRKISGRQLEELQKHTWMMSEAYGLDTRVDNYKGKRPHFILPMGFGLPSWRPSSCLAGRKGVPG